MVTRFDRCLGRPHGSPPQGDWRAVPVLIEYRIGPRVGVGFSSRRRIEDQGGGQKGLETQ